MPEPSFVSETIRAKCGKWGEAIATEIETNKHIDVKTTNVSDDTLVATITCFSDRELVRLADAFQEFPLGFPRGFSVVLSKSGVRDPALSVFYPKFANDTRSGDARFLGADYLTAYIKYSGSLLKCCLYERDAWVVTSKNSADPNNKHVRAFRDLVAPFMHDADFRARMWESGVRSFCAEAFWDQTHGYATRLGLVVTCASTNTEFLDADQLFCWCTNLGLPTDPPFRVHGGVATADFIEKLERARNFMTLDNLSDIMPDHCLVNHRKYVKSSVVEGLVITLSDGQRLKYKFGPYQVVTQFLRPALQRESTLAAKPDTDAETFPLKDMDDYEWQMRKLQTMAQWLVNPTGDGHVARLWHAIMDRFRDADSTVESVLGTGRWITLSEHVFREFLPVFDPRVACARLGLTVEPRKSSHPVVLVMGPIGSGKTTACSNLKTAVHIDGDEFLPPRVVKELKWARNSSTVAAVMGAVCKGRIPVVSTGGGALWHFPPAMAKAGMTGCYLTHVAATMGLELDLTLVIPDDLEAAYENSDDRVRSVIKRRIEDGDKSWNMERAVVGSRANKRYAQDFQTVSPKPVVVTYPANDFINFADRLLLPSKVVAPALVNVRMWQQWFTLDTPFVVKDTQVQNVKGPLTTKLYHRTLSYLDNPQLGPVPTTKHAAGEVVEASAVFCYINKKALCSFISLPDDDDAAAHLTVAEGPFKPQVMKTIAAAVTHNGFQSPLPAMELETSNGLKNQFKIEFWTQPISVRAHAVVPFC